MSASPHNHDAVEAFLQQTVSDFSGKNRPGTPSGQNTPGTSPTPPAPDQHWVPLTVVPVAALVIARFGSAAQDAVAGVSDVVGDAPARIVASVVSWCTSFWPLIVAALVVCVGVDVLRWYARRHRQTLRGQVSSTTGAHPRSVGVSWPPGWYAPRRATVKMPVGTVISEKRYEALVGAVTASANSFRGSGSSAVQAVRDRYEMTRWVMRVQWQAGTNRLVITRTRYVDPAAAHTAQQKRLDVMLAEKFPLPDARVSAVDLDDAGTESGFTIGYSPTIHAARPALQQALREALIASLPPYPVAEGGQKRNWTVTVYPEREQLVIGLAAALPTFIAHQPVDYTELDDDHRYLIAFATGADDVVGSWDVGPSTARPHFLGVGPTGAGKTVMLLTIIVGAVMRGIPVLAIDPKRIELNGLEGFPGVAAVVYSLRQIVQMINAVHAEMMARSDYIAKTHLSAESLTPFIVIMDEFFVMSAFIRRAAAYKGSDPELKELQQFIADSAPMTKHAENMAMGRKVGVRIASGIQRPDAKNFGEDAGSVRDNYGMRASVSNLSSDGAYMMWEDTTIGRDLDTSRRGRATIIGPDGAPMSVQVHWTPNVDTHPNAWAGLNKRDREIVTALRDAAKAVDETPTWYSAEMRAFVESMSATAPEPPTVINGVDPVTDGDDGFIAEELTPGDRIIGDDAAGSVLTVVSVDVLKTVVRVRLRDPDNPNTKVFQQAEYAPKEIVLAAPDLLTV